MILKLGKLKRCVMNVKKRRHNSTKKMKQIEKIAWKEFELNLKHQLGEVKEFTQVGYEFEKGYYVIALLFPKLNKILKQK